MSLSGFMKQINKANQILSEKIGGAKGTELDDSFQTMEKKTDVINRLVDDLRDKTTEFLQPNPASRAKLWTVNNLSKIRGQIKNTPYPQPEGTLGESMSKYGSDLGTESNFGRALIDMGECLRQMAGIKYALEDNVKQNFLDPLAQLKDTELKEVMFLRKKMESRRLDYDCKKRKQKQGSALNDDEIRVATEKFDESKVQAEEAMNHLLNNEVEHITHLIGFAEGLLEYHSQCCEILKDICKSLNEKKRLIPSPHLHNRTSTIQNNTANNKRSEISSSRFYDSTTDRSSSLSNSSYSDGYNNMTSIKPTYPQLPAAPVGFKVSLDSPPAQKMPMPPPVHQRSMNGMPSSYNSGFGSSYQSPSCRGIYDFDAENHEELEFKEGDIIKLVKQLDENWYLGELNGRQGRFPVSYVEVIVPLPR